MEYKKSKRQPTLISIFAGKPHLASSRPTRRQLLLVTLLTLFFLGVHGEAGRMVYAGNEFDSVLDGLRDGSNSDTSKEALDDFFSSKTIKHKNPPANSTKKVQKKPTPTATPSKAVSPSAKTPNAKKSGDKIFNSVEFRGRINKLPKWSSVLSKMNVWKGYLDDPKTKDLKFAAKWQEVKNKAENAPKREQVKVVNSYFNKWPYRTDINNFGMNDYWASPPEFLRKSGDCEDYAIAKFYALKELGFSNEEMRVVAVRDTIRNLGHAVLVVYLDGDALVLDNQTNMLLSHTKYKHYKPAYSVNEKYRWMHVTPMKKK